MPRVFSVWALCTYCGWAITIVDVLVDGAGLPPLPWVELILVSTGPGQAYLLGVAGWQPLWGSGACWNMWTEWGSSAEEHQGRLSGPGKVDGECQKWHLPLLGQQR